MMRRLLPLSLLVMLPGCDFIGNYVGNPFAGFGTFIGNTISFDTNPNRPQGDTPNLRRVRGDEQIADPLTPEPGNVWPGPLPPAKTLSDLQRDSAQPLGGMDPDPTPRITPPRGSSIPPAPLPRASAPILTPPPANQPLATPRPQSRVFQTPQGPAITNVGGNGIETFTLPNGMTGTVSNNGNGTATLIRSDGVTTVVTVPR